jgi:hypothetical protein
MTSPARPDIEGLATKPTDMQRRFARIWVDSGTHGEVTNVYVEESAPNTQAKAYYAEPFVNALLAYVASLEAEREEVRAKVGVVSMEVDAMDIDATSVEREAKEEAETEVNHLFEQLESSRARWSKLKAWAQTPGANDLLRKIDELEKDIEPSTYGMESDVRAVAAEQKVASLEDAVTELRTVLAENATTIEAALAREIEHTKRIAELERRVEEAEGKLNKPELLDFSSAVVLEAAHQRERWGTEHDAGKAPSDWFWLLGYLSGKALAAHIAGNVEKALHHTISSAAALCNWHGAILGTTNMRPGIEPPKDEARRMAAGEEGGTVSEQTWACKECGMPAGGNCLRTCAHEIARARIRELEDVLRTLVLASQSVAANKPHRVDERWLCFYEAVDEGEAALAAAKKEG